MYTNIILYLVMFYLLDQSVSKIIDSNIILHSYTLRNGTIVFFSKLLYVWYVFGRYRQLL